MRALTRYEWPGNIRELQNLMERSVILSSGPVLRVPLQDLPQPSIHSFRMCGSKTLEEVERAHILATLEQSNWVVAGKDGAAARLGMKRSTVHFWMNKLGIVRPGKQVVHGSFPGRQLCS
jgi:formate hydrogenlyase transcriptional activator